MYAYFNDSNRDNINSFIVPYKGMEIDLNNIKDWQTIITLLVQDGNEVKLSDKAISAILRTKEGADINRKNLSNMEDQKTMFKTGLSLMKELARNNERVAELNKKIADTDIVLAKKRKEKRAQVIELETKHSGGIITEDGIVAVQKGEVVVDDILVARLEKTVQMLSGLNLMNLQRESLAGQAAGSSAVTVVNNSSQQINQSRPMILPPSPIVPGNGGSTLAGT